MGRITETHNAVVNVTMVTVCVAEETNVYWWTWDSEVNSALMGLGLKKYIKLTVRLHTVGEVWYLRLHCSGFVDDVSFSYNEAYTDN